MLSPRSSSALESSHFEHMGWRFTCKKGQMLPSYSIAEWGVSLNGGDRHEMGFPDAVYGSNLLALEHVESGVNLAFTALDALQTCKLDNHSVSQPPSDRWQRNIPQVSYAQHWQEHAKVAKKYAEVKEASSTYDWTFTTPFWGRLTVEACDWQDPTKQKEAPELQLPMELLMRQDPILWFQTADLFEDDLADNGVTRADVKVRVMGRFWFVLLRNEVRVDNVIIRQVDTRMFHEFGSDFIMREFVWKEATMEQLKARGVDLGPGNPHVTSEKTGTQLLTQADVKCRYMQRIELPKAQTHTPAPPTHTEPAQTTQ